MLRYLKERNLRLGVLHAGGPAPGGNKVIYAAAQRARDHGIEMIGFQNGYQYLLKGEAAARAHLQEIGREQLRYLRDQNALVIGTSRANPGKSIVTLDDLSDPTKSAPLQKVLDVFEALRIGALVSVGGDDTMRSAYLLQLYLNNLVAKGVSPQFQGVVHVPKTIDKDYRGIDFTFGFMTAAAKIAGDIKNLHDDAKATGIEDKPVYHVVEVMGRDTGWVSAAAGIGGEASLTLVPETYRGRTNLTVDELAEECVSLVLHRIGIGKPYGVIILGEGIGELINVEVGTEEHGHAKLDEVDLAQRVTTALGAKLKEKGIPDSKIHHHKRGYDARQIDPSFFDTLLGFALGCGAANAILRGEFGKMVSIEGVFTPKLIPFEALFDPSTLRAEKWYMIPDEGLYQLMRAMEHPIGVGLG